MMDKSSVFRGVALSTLSAAVLVQISCSYMVQCVIANTGREAIHVTYRYHPSEQMRTGKPWPCQLADLHGDSPLVYQLPKSLKPPEYGTASLPVPITVDSSTCSVSLDLPPNHGVVVWHASGGTLERFPFLTEIVVSSPGNTASYSGHALLQAFRRVSDQLYVLSYGNELGSAGGA